MVTSVVCLVYGQPFGISNTNSSPYGVPSTTAGVIRATHNSNSIILILIVVAADRATGDTFMRQKNGDSYNNSVVDVIEGGVVQNTGTNEHKKKQACRARSTIDRKASTRKYTYISSPRSSISPQSSDHIQCAVCLTRKAEKNKKPRCKCHRGLLLYTSSATNSRDAKKIIAHNTQTETFIHTRAYTHRLKSAAR